jgi:hypothetical protein
LYITATTRDQVNMGVANSLSGGNHLQEIAEGTAAMVHAIIVGEGDCSAERIREEAEMGTAPWVWQVLAKHDPKRFALENLEAMQDTNYIMRSGSER